MFISIIVWIATFLFLVSNMNIVTQYFWRATLLYFRIKLERSSFFSERPASLRYIAHVIKWAFPKMTQKLAAPRGDDQECKTCRETTCALKIPGDTIIESDFPAAVMVKHMLSQGKTRSSKNLQLSKILHITQSKTWLRTL